MGGPLQREALSQEGDMGAGRAGRRRRLWREELSEALEAPSESAAAGPGHPAAQVPENEALRPQALRDA
jgi:hypothetical protein